ncbi:MAG: hypothetical protein F6K28_58405 [Microcoleus sp. SIO2G3]|nr:hypothetical protein [Microcoleus sp. SIO2G3]
MSRIKWLLLWLSVLLLIGYWQITNPNYGRLEALLADHKWQEADQQTAEIILKESNWEIFTWKMWGVALLSGKPTGWYEPIKQYPCHGTIVKSGVRRRVKQRPGSSSNQVVDLHEFHL